MRTGVTHQLRVHLATLGHPIVGDLRYGSIAAHHGTATGASWHFLHAWRVRCDTNDLTFDVATGFPAHWRRFFAARGWPATLAR
jgi:23S rRNA-/tRNA-specific pseudouridylate synthase